MGRCKNLGNTLRKARRAGLTRLDLTLDECRAGIEECWQHLKLLSLTARGLRKVHLCDRLINVEDISDTERCKAIKQIITRENQRSTWRAIKKVVNDPRLGAITKVEKDTPEGPVAITDLDGMVTEIQQVTKKVLRWLRVLLQLIPRYNNLLDSWQTLPLH